MYRINGKLDGNRRGANCHHHFFTTAAISFCLLHHHYHLHYNYLWTPSVHFIPWSRFWKINIIINLSCYHQYSWKQHLHLAIAFSQHIHNHLVLHSLHFPDIMPHCLLYNTCWMYLSLSCFLVYHSCFCDMVVPPPNILFFFEPRLNIQQNGFAASKKYVQQ